jgi:Kef-type K+ transport system membrane component KefB/nucleotide-binding universal stress UspA family protein
MSDAHILATFLAQLIILMLVGRALGEVMTRIGQPGIFGQLLAGVILGPSLFGLLLPELHKLIFPDSAKMKTMIDAISQVGILLLLLLTGMETNVDLVRRRFKVVMATSLSGIAVPFACGLALGFVIPESLVPDEGRRLVTALFIGTALSISSVKIVAMVLMQVGFIRRDLGQLILATAILDDSIAWIIVSIIAGMATRGAIDFGQIGLSIAAAVAFLAVSLTLGRRLVAKLIRWSNDYLSIEFPVITTVLVVTFSMALMTDLIGVHSALGAFVAGVIIGQAPILKGHIELELRGLILAFFSPVFFAVAGLQMDLTALASPLMIGLAVTFVVIASVGKTLGALMGGHFAGLSWRESLAMATGLNARGSTEVIIATIGISLGVLSETLYTLIVAMAIITTMIMPPTLRWALSRVPMRAEERERLEKEEAAVNDYLPGMERVLVIADQSSNGQLSLRLAGAFAAELQIMTTVLEAVEDAPSAEKSPAQNGVSLTRDVAETVNKRFAEIAKISQANKSDLPARMPVETLIQQKQIVDEDSGEAEVAKGYNLVFAGLDNPLDDDGLHFKKKVNAFLNVGDLPVGILFQGRTMLQAGALPRHILVPTDGTQSSLLATEIAVALAHAAGSRLTILHVIEHDQDRITARRFSDPEQSVLHQADVLARRQSVETELREIVDRHPNRVIRRISQRSSFDLVVMGSDLRQDSGKFLGPRSRELIKTIHVPLLIIVK